MTHELFIWAAKYHSDGKTPNSYQEALDIMDKLSHNKVSTNSLRDVLKRRIGLYLQFYPHRMLASHFNSLLKQLSQPCPELFVVTLPPTDQIQFKYWLLAYRVGERIVSKQDGFCMSYDYDQRIIKYHLADGNTYNDHDVTIKWHQQFKEMMAFGQQQMDLGFPQTHRLMQQYVIQQLSPVLMDLNFTLEPLVQRTPQINPTDLNSILNAVEPDIVFTCASKSCQIKIGLDGQCGMYEIFADLVFSQTTEQIAQLFNQPFTGSELTVSVNQLINWQLPVDYRSIRSFEDVTRFISGFNQQLVPLLKQL
ncbi:MAG: hypothetical protein H6996_11340 [Moraxellaceae bacterium]|nr:hypothetical protein [Pseudomonadales bacterium]MCP5175683.1 hypothetical protein [Moraxellaceae bacterium]MCP5177957.1 hypothetical protein [Moraxellaceae bacterium]